MSKGTARKVPIDPQWSPYCVGGTVPHAWRIASPNGPTSLGECVKCGDVREFSNVAPYTGTIAFKGSKMEDYWLKGLAKRIT